MGAPLGDRRRPRRVFVSHPSGRTRDERTLTPSRVYLRVYLYPPCCFGVRARDRPSGRFLLLGAERTVTDRPRLSVYVDGFNFYYGAVKGTANKWCDLSALVRLLLPGNDIHRIRYFTARVQPRPTDPDVHVRQQTYIRALETIPNLSTHYGRFVQRTVRMKVAKPPPARIEVIKTEEKGSDVSLASYLLMDGFNDDFDVAAVVSNDSDLITPIKMVVDEMHREVILLNPHPQPARDLMAVASSYRAIRAGALAASQFPATLADSHGTFTKPADW